MASLFLCLLTSPARADFGISEAAVGFTDAGGLPANRAGSHLSGWTTSLAMNTDGFGEPEGAIRSLRVQLPPGLVGVLAALSACPHATFDAHACSPASAVGTLSADVVGLGHIETSVYALSPSPGAAAELGASAAGKTALVQLTIATAAPHNVVATFANLPVSFSAATLTIDAAVPGGSFLIMPRACTGPLAVRFEAESVEQPGVWDSRTATTQDDTVPPNPLGLSGCAQLPYAPTLSATPGSDRQSSPSGLHVSLEAPDPSLLSLTGFASADTERAVLSLPEGMTLNPAVAAGLAACTPAELERETVDSPPGGGCPPAAKLGTATVRSPLFDAAIAGTIYVAQPDDPATAQPGAENPFDSLLALYLVLRDPERGILLSLPIEVAADRATGRLTATIDRIPQLPISKLELDLREGPRAPLTTPGACGPQQIDYRLTPSSGAAPVAGASRFSPSSCAPPGFAPTLSAGTVNLAAGRSSPFVLDLDRQGGEADLSSLSLTLPPGLGADLGAVPPCPDSLAAAGACPPGSKLGYARIALGSGTEPLWVPPGAEPSSAVYLAGPYRHAPFSLVIVVPAQAGPFDLGTVVTRAAIFVDPKTAQARVRLDPLPQILDGVPLAYRTLRVVLDRAGFVHNPTSCAATAANASVASATGTVAPTTDRFQVADCASLGFKPGVTVRLLGEADRGAHPRLRAVVSGRLGDANVGNVAVTLPATELLDYRHIRAVCSSSQLAAGSCPDGSVVGHVKAWTPLLSRPLEGPVYLRSSGRRLPDLAASLDGQVQIDLSASVRSVDGRLRVAFGALPDAPVSKFVLTMAGGRKGLLANTGGVCARRPRVAVSLRAQSGKGLELGPHLGTDCTKAGKKK